MPLNCSRLLLALCATLAAGPATADAPTDAELDRLHREVGQTLDRRYYAAGRRVDLARFDLEELGRQGRPAPRAIVRQVDAADAELRSRWQGLEGRRAALAARLAALPPAGDHVLALENVEPGVSGERWVGLRSASLVADSGARVGVDLPIAAFKNAPVQKNYSYRVDAPADAIFAYSPPSTRSLLLTGFSLPAGLTGNALLHLTGLDDDRSGRTHIRVFIDGRRIFDGPAPFKDDTWKDTAFFVPDGTMNGASPRDAAARTLESEFDALSKGIDRFGAWADDIADRIDSATHGTRQGLVWRPMKVEPDFWQRHFLRGVCYVPSEQELTHHFRSFRHLGANLLYSYTGLYNPASMFPATLAAAKEIGIPYAQFAKELNQGRPNPLGLGETDETVRRTREFRRAVEGDSGVKVHIAVDEPRFLDTVAPAPGVLREFRAWLDVRKSALAAAGMTVLADPAPVLKPTSNADRPLWMEWQMFKGHALARHLRALWDGLANDGALTFVITQDLLSHEPQAASHVDLGRALPMLSNDLYSNGGVREAFVMDLQRNGMDGPAILTAGAGYSDRTPSRFRRSLAIGMTHAEGVLQWTDVYFAKYRDPKLFWAKPSDDQGRDILLSWNPRYWRIMEEEYARMARADRFLTGVASTATTAVLLSERTAISDTETSPEAYTTNAVAVYSDLLRRGRPLDACFVESLTPDALRRYRVLVLPDARVLTAGECETLRQWVGSGGTLIATAETSLYDEWGRRRRDFALADVLGAHHTSAAIRREGARVIGRRDDGSPTLLKNVYGRGRCFLFTDRRLGERSGHAAGFGLAGEGLPDTVTTLAGLVDTFADRPAVSLAAACDGVELQVFRKGPAYVVHLVDWKDNRTLSGLRLKVSLPGRWRARYPTDATSAVIAEGSVAMRPFTIHEMLVLEPG